eukprot:5501053-Pyramimonas_sp.AAC.1
MISYLLFAKDLTPRGGLRQIPTPSLMPAYTPAPAPAFEDAGGSVPWACGGNRTAEPWQDPELRERKFEAEHWQDQELRERKFEADLARERCFRI